MKRLAASAALVLAAGTPAFAQELTYANVDLALGLISESGTDGTITGFGGEVEYEVNQFFFGATLRYLQLGTDDFEIDTTELGVQAGYMPIDGVLVGAELFRRNQSVSNPTVEFEAIDTEIFAQYESAQFDVALTYGEREFDGIAQPATTAVIGRATVVPDVVLLASFDVEEDIDGLGYLLGVRYETGPIAAVASYASNTEAESGFFSVEAAYDINDQLVITGEYEANTGIVFDVGLVSVQSAYDMNELLTLKAGYSTEIGSDASDSSFFQIGADYTIAANTKLTFDYGQETGDFEQSFIFVGLSYELGETARLDSRIRDDYEVDPIFDSFLFGGS